jgi:hypothetical protein
MMPIEEDHKDKDGDYLLGDGIGDNGSNMTYTGVSSHAEGNSSIREDDSKTSAARSLGFSQTEQNIVNCSRFSFLFWLLLVAVGLAAAIYVVGRHDERDDFKEEVRFGVTLLLFRH